jgi:hypothetical protein
MNGHAPECGSETQFRHRNCFGRSNCAYADCRTRVRDFPRDRQTPEALAAYQKAEIEKWWQIIKAAGIKGE